MAFGARTVRYKSISPPLILGKVISKTIANRWDYESRGLGPTDNEIARFAERARARPFYYDILAAIGRGPVSPGLTYQSLKAARAADIILCGFCPLSTVLLGTWVAHRTKTPLVVLPLFHPEDIYHHFASFYRCFSSSSAVLTQTPYSTALIKELSPGSRTEEIGAGVDHVEFSEDKAIGERFRQKFGLQNKKIILYVGRKELHKNYSIAIDAIERISDESLVLVMIGADVDGLAINSSRVHYLGALSRADLIDAYDSCELLIFPSAHESFGIVLLEAWMRAKPVLGYARCLPVASIIEHGKNGYLCRDTADFSRRIEQLISDREECQVLGSNGREKVLARYTWDKISSRVAALYTDLTNGIGA